ILRETETDVLVSYLPVGAEEATKWYVEQALTAGCAFVNCIPVFIGREPYWRKRFAQAGLPIIGDDIKSQVGATIVHRMLARLFQERGVRLERTSQLNVGGNMDFYNMLERERLESKKISKTNAVTSMLDHELDPSDIHVGPSDYVPWLSDRKFCHIRMEGRTFGDVPLNLELKLEVWDSPNSAGVVIDAIRCCKLAMDRGLSGALIAPSAYFMKAPPVQYKDDKAHRMVEKFIADLMRMDPDTARKVLNNEITAEQAVQIFERLDPETARGVIKAGIFNVEGLTPIRGAAKVAREFGVDYGKFTEEENTYLRGLMFLFYAWTRQNTPNWFRYITRNPGGFLAKFLAPWFAVVLWNNTIDEELEQSLPPWKRDQLHLITGYKDEDGKDIIIYFRGAPFVDALE
ncbi:hypothetical protein LCGC14_2830910, partial [marine sediment metagenome]